MRAFIIGAARTIIAPKNGFFRDLPLEELARPALLGAWSYLGLGFGSHAGSFEKKTKSRLPKAPQAVIFGNALGAGGNPARLCTLAAFQETTPALTIDTQCTSGLDAVGLAANLIRGQACELVIAGGVESFSQAPLRFRATADGLKPYTQARFAPNHQGDPDVLEAAYQFALKHRIKRIDQERYAIKSHKKALQSRSQDPYSRRLTPQVCERFLPLGEKSAYSITSATVAPQADASAALLIANERWARYFPWAIEIADYCQVGVASHEPAWGGVSAGQALLSRLTPKQKKKIASAEVMESFSAQAIVTIRELGLPEAIVNPWGGMLARGHPISASGAVLAGNLFFQLQNKPEKSLGFAVIPSAGGLGSAILLKRPKI